MHYYNAPKREIQIGDVVDLEGVCQAPIVAIDADKGNVKLEGDAEWYPIDCISVCDEYGEPIRWQGYTFRVV